MIIPVITADNYGNNENNKQWKLFFSPNIQAF